MVCDAISHVKAEKALAKGRCTLPQQMTPRPGCHAFLAPHPFYTLIDEGIDTLK